MNCPIAEIFLQQQHSVDGVWSTQDSRAMMAYWRTGRQQLAKASMERMLEGFASEWIMDAPLTQFGATTWGHDTTMLTYDAFGHASAVCPTARHTAHVSSVTSCSSAGHCSEQ